LARNFGQANAIAAGLDHISKEVTVIMDSDLQDPPEDIPLLIDAMIDKNVSMAVARWITRKDNAFKIGASRFFHFLSNKITDLHHMPGLGVFRAMTRPVVDALKQIPEKTATSISILYWMGFDYTVVDLHRDERYAGTTGYTLRKMVRISFDRIFSFSLFPIRLASIVGVFLGLSSIGLAIYYVCRKFIYQNIVPGWTSLVVLILFLFGINFIFLGIIGEYLGRIFLETKQRPKYIVAEIHRNRNVIEG
jgi:dolichol-phosphate mannosyltransferase